MTGGAGAAPLAWRGMAQLNPRSGGIFLAVGVLAGFAWGIAGGDPVKGVVVGAALGTAAALLLWLVDRRR